MKRMTPALAAGALAITAFLAPSATAAPAPAADSTADARDVPRGIAGVGLTATGQLVNVRVNTGDTFNRRSVQGVRLGEKLVGIDRRPVSGALFGLVKDRLGTDARVVRINAVTGKVNRSRPLRDADGDRIKLRGFGFGVDFNPEADALRVTSTSRQNLRINVDSGSTTVDGRLAFAKRDRASGKPTIVASAYTNNDQFPSTSTALYNLDARRGTLVRQDPPNDGTLRTVGRVRGVAVTPISGLDITSRSDLGVISTPGLLSTRLVVIDLSNGNVLRSERAPLVTLTDIALNRSS